MFLIGFVLGVAASILFIKAESLDYYKYQCHYNDCKFKIKSTDEFLLHQMVESHEYIEHEHEDHEYEDHEYEDENHKYLDPE